MNEYLKDFLCGAIAGLFGCLVSHPFDTLKCRIQVNNNNNISSMQTLIKIVRIEGFTVLYKGSWATFMTQCPINALLFSEFGRFRRFMEKNQFNKHLIYFFSGCYSGLTCLFFICPIEHIKCRQQLENQKNNNSLTQVSIKIVRHLGPLGLFRGFWSTFNRDFLSFGVYFWTYYTFKDAYIKRYNKFESSMQLLAGGTAGVCAWIVTYPFDFIKTIIQSQSLNEATLRQSDILKKIRSERGLIHIFKGIQVSLIYAFSLNSAIYFGNEVSQFHFDQYYNKV